MIRFTEGNLLEARAEAVVNTVNELGVMGKGIALMFREHFPESAKAYMDAASRKEIHVGTVFVTASSDLLGPRWVIHFPTKKHWRHPSKMEWVRTGLRDLRRVVREKGIRSIAVPPLGCGNGGLDWTDVRHEIEQALGDLEGTEVIVYAPTAKYHNAPKRAGVTELTPARAMIAELVRRYGVLGFECSHLEIQKLAWFLKRGLDRFELDDPLALRFQAHKYGPYSEPLRHLLNGLDGSYLHCAKRLADAGPFEPIWFEPARREDLRSYLEGDETRRFGPALEWTASLIDGFESPFGLELLATVDWLLHEEHVEPTVDALLAGIGRWPGGESAAERKQRIFDARTVGIALERVRQSDAVDPSPRPG